MAQCPECGAATRREGHQTVCPVCGLVVEGDAYEHTPPAPAAAGPIRGLGRLHRAQQRAEEVSSSQQRLREAAMEVRRIGAALGCPSDVADRAIDLFVQARQAGLTQGRRLDALAPAALLVACRMLRLARTEEDLASHARVPWRDIQNAYKALVQGLRLPVPPMTAHEYMGDLASRLELPPRVEARARGLLQAVCGTNEAAGKNPIGWAGAALLLAAREHGIALSVNRVAKSTGAGHATVQARLDDLAAMA